MRMTWLQMVQDILNDMDSDPVDTYTHTVESQQVSQILQTVYFNIVDSKEWPHFLKGFTITETSGATPTHMVRADDVKSLKYVKYETAANTYTLVKFLEPQRFMNLLDARTTGFTTITDTAGIKFKILTNVGPVHYTSFDERTLIFDSYNSGVDSFLRTTKTQCYGSKYPTLTISDGVYVDLPVELFSLLLAEAKAISFRVLKQSVNVAAELFSQSQRELHKMQGWKIRENFKIPDFTTQPVMQPQQQGGGQRG